MRKRLERFRENQQCSDAGSVVGSAVVDGIAVDGRADAQMIGVSAVDDIFAFEGGSEPGSTATTFGLSVSRCRLTTWIFALIGKSNDCGFEPAASLKTCSQDLEAC